MKENTRRKALEQQYEQAAFALLLDDLMAEEGAALLHETDGAASADVPPEADGRCIKAIRRADTKARRGQVLRFAGKAVSRVAVVFLVVAIAFSVPFCTVSAFRDAALGYMLRTFDTGTDISLYGIPENQPYLGGGHPAWFPVGSWTLTETLRDDSMYVIRYEATVGDCIEYSELAANGLGLAIDTEDADVKTDVVIRGWSATISIKENRSLAVWLDEENNIFCTLLVYGDNIDNSKEILLRIAENIK